MHSARSKGYYKLVGTAIAWSLIHGGPGGNFLSKSLYNAIAFSNGNCRVTHIEDIADKYIREKVAVVCFLFVFYYL
jgi:hypothetical protein